MMRTRMFVLALAVLSGRGRLAHRRSPFRVAGKQAQAGRHQRWRPTSIKFRVEVGSCETLDVNTKGGGFTRLFIPGFHTSRIEGEPELPMMNRLVSIPIGATAPDRSQQCDDHA